MDRLIESDLQDAFARIARLKEACIAEDKQRVARLAERLRGDVDLLAAIEDATKRLRI
jgi:hypothetical protein